METATGAHAVKLYPLGMSASRRSQLTAGMDVERSVLGAGLIPIPLPVAAGGEWLVELDNLLQVVDWLGVLHAMHRPGGDTAQLPAFDADRRDAAVQNAHRRRLDRADHRNRCP